MCPCVGRALSRCGLDAHTASADVWCMHDCLLSTICLSSAMHSISEGLIFSAHAWGRACSSLMDCRIKNYGGVLAANSWITDARIVMCRLGSTAGSARSTTTALTERPALHARMVRLSPPDGLVAQRVQWARHACLGSSLPASSAQGLVCTEIAVYRNKRMALEQQ